MMNPHEGKSSSSSLSCELTIIKARNMDHMKLSGGSLFVRCYLSAGNKARVALNSQEILIPSKSFDATITWNHTFSLDCSGNEESIRRLKQETLVFELRWRSASAVPFISRLIQGSKLIGRAEIPWSEVQDTNNVKIEKWVVMIPQNINDGRDHLHDMIIKPPAVQIAMRVNESDHDRKEIDGGNWDECCGNDGCKSCVDYEIFAIEAAFEALL